LLKLTTAYYQLPTGRLIHKRNGVKNWGVLPDVSVLVTPEQSRRWLEVRQKAELLRDADPDQMRSELSQQLEADLQLNTAVLLLKLMWLEHQDALKAAA